MKRQSDQLLDTGNIMFVLNMDNRCVREDGVNLKEYIQILTDLVTHNTGLPWQDLTISGLPTKPCQNEKLRIGLTTLKYRANRVNAEHKM